MTPEERAERALIDTPYRTPKSRIAREIQETRDEERADFRAILEQISGQAGRLEVVAAEAGADLRDAILALRCAIDAARDRLR